ncbi:MAG: sigma 54-dependent Fis family transcriptional regulator [Acidobacteria bacterium]|nr:sigma 54-dependent Fis family transcriptional regulator [Acidobacteriota bacterium]
MRGAMGKLLVSLGSMPLLAFELEDGTTLIGRARANGIVLTLPEIADAHAELTISGPEASIRAVGEESVLVNGHLVKESSLAPGDVALLGGYRLRWSPPGSEAPSATDAPSAPGTHSHSTNPEEGSSNVDESGSVQRVIVVGGLDVGLSVDLDAPALLAGRAPDCDLILQDPAVSWRHASFERVPEGLRVRDLGSRNGTHLEGRRVEAAVARIGSRVRIGRSTLLLTTCGDAGDLVRTSESSRSAGPGLAELTGRSEPMQKVYARILEAAAGNVPALLVGETGTGKELTARAIHALGQRARGPFVPLNCAAIPREMMEDQLFGHVKGAFTGAASDHRGAFEEASGGTIFLDEITELPPDLQPKLLRVLDDGIVPRIGGGSARSDFRVVAATNRNPSEEMAVGRFRKDLYFRLSVAPIALPPLRDRIEDLPDLVHVFLEDSSRHTGVAAAGQTRVDEDALAPLREHLWPGNVRELRNLILRAVMRAQGGAITRNLVEELLAETAIAEAPSATAPRSLEEIERAAISHALRDCDGQRRAAARRLGIAESTLYEKIRRYGLAGER